LARIPAQNNLDSPDAFNAHWITISAGTFYDPSYGASPVGNSKDYEDAAFAGYTFSGSSYVIRPNLLSGSSSSEVAIINADKDN
jgi:hypothetical protein